MFLKQTNTFTPNQYAYNLNSKPNSLAVHPSSDYLAFVTRNQQLVMFNRKTGRTAITLKSKHNILFILYTEQYLIAVEKNFPQILVYSLKSEKIKKKLSAHRTQVERLAYCTQRGLISSISHDVCIIWEQATLNIVKKLKCSTSQYSDSIFSPNGKYLFTSFADGNIFRWDLDSFEYTQAALSIKPHLFACTYSNFIVAYEPKSVMIADFTREGIYFEEMQAFWEGAIEKVDFSGSNILIKTSAGFYLGKMSLEYKIMVKQASKLVEKIHSFVIGGYGEEVITVSKDLVWIKTMKIYNEKSSAKIPLTNPLINPGAQCAGGFSDKEGCIADQGTLQTYAYQDQQYKAEQMNNGLYECTESLGIEKLQAFIKKNFFFPDKYRPIAYKSLLALPINKNMYRELEKKGRHECVKMLASKYPLQNRNLAQAFKDVISLLANYCPIFAQSQDVPTVVFPFVCLFGNDLFFCFQILYKLFNNWLSYIFTDFPLANSDLLQNMYEMFEVETPQILHHFKSNNISFTKLVWNFMSTLFASNVRREVFLAIVDTLFAHPSQPQFIVFITIAYISYNQSRILTLKSQADLDTYLESEHTINTSVFLKKAYETKQKYKKSLRYPFQVMNPSFKKYIPFEDYPKHAVKMYEGKRKLEQEQYDRVMGNKKYHEEMAKQMGEMMVKAKRDTRKAMIQTESIALHNENQCKNKLNLPTINTKLRRQRLQEMIDQLKSMIEQSDEKKSKMKELAPMIKKIEQVENEQELDILQYKLMQMLTQFQPHRFHQPLKSVPIPLDKKKTDDYKQLKAAKNAQMASKLWENDRIHHKVEQQNWQQNFMKAVK